MSDLGARLSRLWSDPQTALPDHTPATCKLARLLASVHPAAGCSGKLAPLEQILDAAHELRRQREAAS